MMNTMYERIGVKADLYQRVLFVLDGGWVKRFHPITTIKDITVGHHQYGVAWLCYLLSDGKASANLLMSALSHDLPEQVLGDMPSPGKRLLGIEPGLFSKSENTLLEDNLCAFHKLLSEEEHNTLKLADYLEGMLSLVQERRLGNLTVVVPFYRYCSYFCDLNVDERAVEIYAVIKDMWGQVCGE
jgi:5'-deoxynucleotidase YfbR-like HD superfamily hydrolase